MLLRPYRPADCPRLAQLFYETVHTVNARDYTPRQLSAWAPGTVDLECWNASFLAHFTLVAEDGGRITGFGDIDPSGYLDRLYVHKDFQGVGIASALCDALERHFSVRTVTTHASLTARPFFAHRGYQTLRRRTVERGGVFLDNFLMEKKMGAPLL